MLTPEEKVLLRPDVPTDNDLDAFMLMLTELAIPIATCAAVVFASAPRMALMVPAQPVLDAPDSVGIAVKHGLLVQHLLAMKDDLLDGVVELTVRLAGSRAPERSSGRRSFLRHAPGRLLVRAPSESFPV